MTGKQLRAQDKDEVHYRPQEKPGENCGVCKHFSPPNSCTQVAGTISESYVCDLFTPGRGLQALVTPTVGGGMPSAV